MQGGGQAPASPLSALLLLSRLSADVPRVAELEQELAWLKEHLSHLESPIVFCHNDLLCKNIIYDSSKGMHSGAAGWGLVEGSPAG